MTRFTKGEQGEAFDGRSLFDAVVAKHRITVEERATVEELGRTWWKGSLMRMLWPRLQSIAA